MLVEPVYRVIEPRHAEVAIYRHTTSRRIAASIEPYCYLVPAIAILVVWVYRPLVETVDYSFYNWNLVPTDPKVYVGWRNYAQLFHLSALWQAIGTSLFFLASMLVCGVVLPLVVALLTQHISQRSRAFYRALLFLPALVSPVVAATVWEFILAPSGGVVDTLLAHLGLAQTNWLQQVNTVRFAIAAIAGWKTIGVSVLVITAGLAAINTEYFEAASVDGASRLQVARRLTIPLLSPTLMFLVITAVLLSSQTIFPLLNVLTQGGPTGATTDLYYFLYEYGFTSFNVGLASAAAVCFFVAFTAIALVTVRLVERFSFHDN